MGCGSAFRHLRAKVANARLTVDDGNTPTCPRRVGTVAAGTPYMCYSRMISQIATQLRLLPTSPSSCCSGMRNAAANRSIALSTLISGLLDVRLILLANSRASVRRLRSALIALVLNWSFKFDSQRGRKACLSGRGESDQRQRSGVCKALNFVVPGALLCLPLIVGHLETQQYLRRRSNSLGQ